MSLKDRITVYVNLLEEGTPTMRPTQAIDMGNGIYQLLATPDYNPEDEIWEFMPGSFVGIKEVEGHFSGKVWLVIHP